MKKLSQEEFISRCIIKHDDIYDYSFVVYKGISSKVSIICKNHGIFKQIAKNHKNGQGCPKCSGNSILTKDEFLSNCDRGDIYDYSLIDGSIRSGKIIRVINRETGIIYQQYARHHLNNITPTKMESESVINRMLDIHRYKYSYESPNKILRSTDKIKLIDNKTNDIFLYRVDKHLQGMRPNKVTLNYFKIKGSEAHSNKYDYSLVEFDGNKDKVRIICQDHGEFIQSVSNHINCGDGCPECAGNGRWDSESLIAEFNKVHFNRYSYSSMNFTTVANKIEIICQYHGIFTQNVNKHLSGQGCKFCNTKSVGEEYIKSYLDINEIEYIRQHGFDTCRHINKLNFDFYLPEYNMCVEFDGIQHFRPVKDFGGKKGFEDGKLRDVCKNKWCEENKVKLLRIKYNQISEISDILKNNLVN